MYYNTVELIGTVSESLGIAKEYGEEYRELIISVKRKSKVEDKHTVVFLASEFTPKKGQKIMVTGEIRELRHFFYVFARVIVEVNQNTKPHNYFKAVAPVSSIGRPRTTKGTERTVLDFTLEYITEHERKRSIWCIAWENKAIAISESLKVGDVVEIRGRFQSRDEGSEGDKITYHEVSVQKVRRV